MPGSVTIGTCRRHRRRVPAGALRHARLHRHLGELDALPGQGVLDHLVRTGRDPAGGDDQVDASAAASSSIARNCVDVIGDEMLDAWRAPPIAAMAAASIGAFDS